MSATSTPVNSTWATMANNNSARANKGGNNAVRVTISDNPVADTWSLPEGATPTIVQSVVPSDASAILDESTAATTPAKQDEEQVVIGTATVARRARGKTVTIGNRDGVDTKRCNYCDQVGHLEKKCPAKAADQATQRKARHEAFLQRRAIREAKVQAFQEREERRKNATCHRCGETGHFKAQCVNPYKEEQDKTALESRIEFAMAEGMTREEAIAGESALAAYEKRAEDEARAARAQKTRAQRKKTELVIGADQGSYELTNGGIVGAFKGYKA
ncbi:hypothetical protein KJ359_001797 [Pestalotiopsis sp. 9143b]|nr:hypothetical protein KJ359_001797 [Pestalotiopsis sp. 9143b]